MIPRKKVQARRPTGGTRVKGEWVDGITSPLPEIKTTIQVVVPKDLQVLPEGRRVTQSWVIYTKQDLNTELEGDGEPDEVNIYGDWCIVLSRGRWSNNLRNHKRYIVQRKTVK